MAYCIDILGDEAISGKQGPLPTITVRNQKSFIVEGWASDEGARLPAGGVEVNIDGKLYPTVYGLDRPDVAKAFKTPSYRFSGFKGSVPISKIGKGRHSLELKVFSNNKKTYSSSKEKINFEIQ